MSLSRIFPTIISSEITAGNALIDSTTANAFIAPVGVDLSPYRGKFMELWSGSTLWAQAWISATAPSGEALDGTNIVTNGDFASSNGWITSVFTISGGTLNANGSGYAARTTVSPLGSLYKLSVDITAYTSGNFCMAFAGFNSPSFTSATPPETKIVYINASTANSQIWFKSLVIPLIATVDNFTAYKVTMPAATGALLLSTQGGSRGWAYKHASFNPNAALTMRILAKRKVSGNGSYLV
jgi:hypothetical protein